MKAIYSGLIAALLIVLPITAANASTVTVMAYPTQNVSNIVINDTVLAVIHYPNGSFVARQVQGRSYTVSYSAFASGPSKPLLELQEALRKYDPNISVINATVTMTEALSSNSTTAVFRRSSVLSVWVSGIFNRTASGVVGDFRWKAFRLDKALYFNFNGHEEDINYFGGDFMEGMGLPFFGDLGEMIPEVSTINFSAFNTPLSQWSRVYDASKNTTYFTKSAPTQVLYSASLTINGQTFSISITSDPSYVIGVQGYATAQGNVIVVSPAPSAPYTDYAAAAVAAVVIVAAVAYVAYRRRR